VAFNCIASAATFVDIWKLVQKLERYTDTYRDTHKGEEDWRKETAWKM
jgi:hypothetical protein